MWKIDHICSSASMIFADCGIASAHILLEPDGIQIEVFGSLSVPVDELDFSYSEFNEKHRVGPDTDFTAVTCRKNGRLVLDFEGSQIRLCRFEDTVHISVLNEQRERVTSLTVKTEQLFNVAA
jgi:hypothetical protein